MRDLPPINRTPTLLMPSLLHIRPDSGNLSLSAVELDYKSAGCIRPAYLSDEFAIKDIFLYQLTFQGMKE